MMEAAVCFLIATNLMWVALLVVGKLRWYTTSMGPTCKDCPLMRPMNSFHDVKDFCEDDTVMLGLRLLSPAGTV